MPNFMAMLRSRWAEGKMVCVGLDSDFEKIPSFIRESNVFPDDAVFEFNQAIINATSTIVCAYKPNIAFYSRKDGDLRQALTRTCQYIRRMAPGVPIILDAKRADIGNTNVGYVIEAFEEFDADAVTVSPYFGQEALKPFLEKADKGIIVLCRTSNPGAGEFQDLPVAIGMGGRISKPLYQIVATHVAQQWNKNGNCALVVGATAPDQLAAVREIVGTMPILVPGIGTQGGDLEATLRAGLTSAGDGLIINSSSKVIFAANDHTYPEAARVEVEKLNTAIRNFRRPQH